MSMFPTPTNTIGYIVPYLRNKDVGRDEGIIDLFTMTWILNAMICTGQFLTTRKSLPIKFRVTSFALQIVAKKCPWDIA